MKHITRQLITRSDGVYNCYNQSTYIRRNHWDDPDSNKRQGAWVEDCYSSSGRVVAYGLGKGICRGLAAAYLTAGHNWSRFTAYLNTEDGKAAVRGISNIQNELFKYGDDKRNIKAFHLFLKIKTMRFINVKRITSSAPYRGLGNKVLRGMAPGFGYHISIFGPHNGHSLAVRIEGGCIKIFDPNNGEVGYSYLQCRSPEMSFFLEHLFNEYYPYVDELYIDRYTLR